ncbi:MAG: agmatinase family protein [Candidatus Planktophila sp.]|nr:agmatinase family protein [Candidatus Planktophila sp.]
MSPPELPHDPQWMRANTLFSVGNAKAEIALIGVPAHESSISATNAHLTPSAVRAALARYSTFSTSANVDLAGHTFIDLGDVESPDGVDGHERVKKAVNGLLSVHKLVIALGGDNSITYSVASALWPGLSNVGLITFDAHHDLRDGHSNGSPVWQLIQAGLLGKNIVQIGITDFANSTEYSARAKENGITVISRAELRTRTISDVVQQALEVAGAGGREIYVDLDVDVCDRSVVPACPAAMPGGISADELRQGAFLLAADKRVRAIDITEIDAALDSPDQRTVRLAALLVLEAASGFASR